MEINEITSKQKLCIDAYAAGKVSVAQNYADLVLEKLFELKRLAAITKFLEQLKTLGYPAKKIINYETRLGHLKGKTGSSVDQLEWHVEHFKFSKEFLKTYLLDEDEWNKDHFTLCYEYLLRFGADIEIFKRLENLKQQSAESGTQEFTGEENQKQNLKCNYDKLAYELISGIKSSGEFEQEKLIEELKLLDFEQMKKEGKEMVTAFRFLGMNELVLFLCEKLIPLYDDVRERASLTFLLVESLMNESKYQKASHVVEMFLKKEPVFGEEKLAFLYLRAEMFFLLGKNDDAKKCFKEIYKQNPHYRLVNQRLKKLEAN